MRMFDPPIGPDAVKRSKHDPIKRARNGFLWFIVTMLLIEIIFITIFG